MLPESDRLAAVLEKGRYGNTTLRAAAGNPESLKIVLSIYPESERLAAVQEKDRYGETVLRTVAGIPESLKIIFNKLPTLDFLIVARGIFQTEETLVALKEKLEELTETHALKSDIRAATTHEELLPHIQRLQAESQRSMISRYKAEQPSEEKRESSQKLS